MFVKAIMLKSHEVIFLIYFYAMFVLLLFVVLCIHFYAPKAHEFCL
jgi:hypothetical protein